MWQKMLCCGAHSTSCPITLCDENIRVSAEEIEKGKKKENKNDSRRRAMAIQTKNEKKAQLESSGGNMYMGMP